jgi:hypothetical protein
MNEAEILSNLCYDDRRNPEYDDVYGWWDEEDRPTRKDDCYCDNCFYRRDRLALEILRLRGELTKTI